jgi:hypothetical protein
MECFKARLMTALNASSHFLLANIAGLRFQSDVKLIRWTIDLPASNVFSGPFRRLAQALGRSRCQVIPRGSTWRKGDVPTS